MGEKGFKKIRRKNMKRTTPLEVHSGASRTRIILNSYRYFDIAFSNLLKIKYVQNVRRNETIITWLEGYLDGELQLPYDFLELEAYIEAHADVERCQFFYDITAGCQKTFLPMYKKIGKKKFQDFFLGLLARSFVEYQDTAYAFKFGRNKIEL